MEANQTTASENPKLQSSVNRRNFEAGLAVELSLVIGFSVLLVGLLIGTTVGIYEQSKMCHVTAELGEYALNHYHYIDQADEVSDALQTYAQTKFQEIGISLGNQTGLVRIQPQIRTREESPFNKEIVYVGFYPPGRTAEIGQVSDGGSYQDSFGNEVSSLSDPQYLFNYDRARSQDVAVYRMATNSWDADSYLQSISPTMSALVVFSFNLFGQDVYHWSCPSYGYAQLRTTWNSWWNVWDPTTRPGPLDPSPTPAPGPQPPPASLTPSEPWANQTIDCSDLSNPQVSAAYVECNSSAGGRCLEWYPHGSVHGRCCDCAGAGDDVVTRRASTPATNIRFYYQFIYVAPDKNSSGGSTFSSGADFGIGDAILDENRFPMCCAGSLVVTPWQDGVIDERVCATPQAVPPSFSFSTVDISPAPKKKPEVVQNSVQLSSMTDPLEPPTVDPLSDPPGGYGWCGNGYPGVQYPGVYRYPALAMAAELAPGLALSWNETTCQWDQRPASVLNQANCPIGTTYRGVPFDDCPQSASPPSCTPDVATNSFLNCSDPVTCGGLHGVVSGSDCMCAAPSSWLNAGQTACVTTSPLWMINNCQVAGMMLNCALGCPYDSVSMGGTMCSCPSGSTASLMPPIGMCVPAVLNSCVAMGGQFYRCPSATTDGTQFGGVYVAGAYPGMVTYQCVGTTMFDSMLKRCD